MPNFDPAWLILILVVAVLASGVWQSRQAEIRRRKDAREAEERITQQNIQDSPSADFAALIHAINTQGRANRDEEKREDWWKTVRETITIILIGLTFAAIVLQVHEMRLVYDPIKDQAAALKTSADAAKIASDAAAKQVTEMTTQSEAAKTAAEIAQKAMIAAQRAWVGPTDAHLDGTPKAGADIDVVINYFNTGREPALSFTVKFDQTVRPAEDDTSGKVAQQISDDLQDCIASNDVAATEVVYPAAGFAGGGERRVTIPGKEVDDDLVNGKKVILVPGCFTYLTFGQVRHSAFCFYYQAPRIKPQHLGFCAQGAYAD